MTIQKRATGEGRNEMKEVEGVKMKKKTEEMRHKKRANEMRTKEQKSEEKYGGEMTPDKRKEECRRGFSLHWLLISSPC